MLPNTSWVETINPSNQLKHKSILIEILTATAVTLSIVLIEHCFTISIDFIIILYFIKV